MENKHAVRRSLSKINRSTTTTACATSESEGLDALLPISMAHWHEHVNLCYPANLRYRPQKVDAGTVFFIKLFFSITSAKECESAGGQFTPVEFGWMAHVYMFAGSDDPKMIWDADDVGNMDMHIPHPSRHTRP